MTDAPDSARQRTLTHETPGACIKWSGTWLDFLSVLFLLMRNLMHACRFSAENFPNILKIVDGLAAIGAKYNGASSSQIALAWLLAQGPDIIPIPGTKNVKVRADSIRPYLNLLPIY